MGGGGCYKKYNNRLLWDKGAFLAPMNNCASYIKETKTNNLPYDKGTLTTTPHALFRSRSTIDLLIVFILLFLFFPVTQVNRGGHGHAGTEATLNLKT